MKNCIIFEIAENVPRNLIGEPARLNQILLNLLNNALKFTSDGYVKFSVDIDKIDKNKNTIDLNFTVEDSGIGIKKNKIECIFDSFLQEDDSITKKYGGTGLGLAICKKITGLMKGKLSVESEQGKGSKFKLSLKFDYLDKENSKSKQSKQTQKEYYYLNRNFEDVTILIVEDNGINQTFRKYN